MEEKERYTIESFEIDKPSCIFDNKTQQRILNLVEYNYDEIVNLEDLLNQQDKRIKELENMNSRLSQGIYWGNGEQFCDVVSKLKKENQQLKQQLDESKSEIEKQKQKYDNLYECYQKTSSDDLQDKYRLADEIDQLKQQLKDNTKQVCEKIREELNNIIEVGDYYDVEKEQETNLYKQSDIENILKQTEKYK